MFDPTIFDNWKVVLEGEIYDRDLSGELQVIHRSDHLDMAAMARALRIQFCLHGESAHHITVELAASAEDLMKEILETDSDSAGCRLTMHYSSSLPIAMSDEELRMNAVRIRHLLSEVWGDAVGLEQNLTSRLSDDGQCLSWNCNTRGEFHRKLNESHIEDIPELVNTMIDLLKRLEAI